MSSNNHLNNYYYPPNTTNFHPVQGATQSSWGNWSMGTQQYAENFQRTAAQYPSTPVNHTNTHTHTPPRNQAFYNNNVNRLYQQRRFNGNGQFPVANNVQQNWQRNYYGKRNLSESSDNAETRGKTNKKRKKPLSQNVPNKKDWSIEDAEKALAAEKEFNKRHKNHSLIIKFPDLELNRDIVSKLHPSIESVHFQQPSTPRFCFVALEDTADPEAVIKALNATPFGQGFLSAEYKRDREEDHNVGPEDIDPFTLYVGNLAQEVTKEDMVKAYPNQRRIDIGYAKKMKYTRYAFVSFKNINDSIEAFKQTHSTQMYSKSLIVRFRRLHGTVGMPGEGKTQNPQKNKNDTLDNLNREMAQFESSPTSERHLVVSNIDFDVDSNHESSQIDLNLVKKEPGGSDDELDKKPFVNTFQTPFLPGSIELAFAQHRPKIKEEIKQEVRTDDESPACVGSSRDNNVDNKINNVYRTEFNSVPVKSEPMDEKKDTDDDLSDDDNESDLNFHNILNNLEDHSKKLKSLSQIVP